jgi:hypothetical protein
VSEILLATESYRSRSPQLANSLLLNYMTEKQPQEAKSQIPLFGAPGIAAFGEALGPCRGWWEWQGAPWGVFGDGLYRFSADGSSFRFGSGIGGTLPVGMSDNGQQLCIVNGVFGWIYDSTNGLQKITDTAFYPARTVTFLDGYFVFDRRDTNQSFWSDLYNGLSYTGTSFLTAEAAPGEVVAVWQNLQFLYIFCTTHLELWYNAGSAGAVPFQRYAGAVIPYGTQAPYAIVLQDGALFFLAKDGIIYRLEANQPRRISNHYIEGLVEAEGDVSHVEGFTYTIQGHKLIFWTFPNIQTTVCYDISTGKWHNRNSVDADMNDLGRWRGRYALKYNNEILIGDAFDGRVGKVQWDTFEEYGLPMLGIIDTVTQHSDRLNVFCSRFELDIQAGVGLATGQGDNPQIMLRHSKDGGMTYGNNQTWRSMGLEGQYTKRLRWLQQGAARQHSWRLEVSDPVRRTIIAPHANFDQGVA